MAVEILEAMDDSIVARKSAEIVKQTLKEARGTTIDSVIAPSNPHSGVQTPITHQFGNGFMDVVSRIKEVLHIQSATNRPYASRSSPVTNSQTIHCQRWPVCSTSGTKPTQSSTEALQLSNADPTAKALSVMNSSEQTPQLELLQSEADHPYSALQMCNPNSSPSGVARRSRVLRNSQADFDEFVVGLPRLARA